MNWEAWGLPVITVAAALTCGPLAVIGLLKWFALVDRWRDR